MTMANRNPAAEPSGKPHTLHLDSRKALTLTGVNEVRSFDDKQIVLRTEGGQMTVDGDGLHVTALVLEEGRMAISGQINAIAYAGRSGRRGLRELLR